MSAATDEPLTFAALRLLARRPSHSQRALALDLGVSVGKVNYLVRALIARGLVKAGNVRRSSNRAAYLYVLTPSGLVEKTRLARRFLKSKTAEYERLQRELALLEGEVDS